MPHPRPYSPIILKMAAHRLPSLSRKLVAVSLGSRFREVVQVQTAEIPKPGPNELLVRTRYVGINASDINWTAGRYIPGVTPPFDTGFEGAGQVAQVGEGCTKIRAGDAVAFMRGGAFSEYFIVPEPLAIPIPHLDPCFVPLLVSGMTASISLEKVGELKSGEKVLITAAAGGTGQFAVQLAKLAGCHVIGTCSTDEKVEFLKSLGCDRPINYKKEDLKSVLKSEYPSGVDVVYECVGGEILNTCLKNLAVKGRLIIIGFITSYQQSTFGARPTLPVYQILLSKSASIRGFFLNHYLRDIPRHYKNLAELYSVGKLKSTVDLGQSYSPAGGFKGLEAIFDAIDYLYTGKSAGKVIVDLWQNEATSKL